MITGENIDNSLNWIRNNTSKLVAKRRVEPLMFMLADLEGFPILEIDKIDLKEDPSLLAGFLSAIESFSQQLFGKKGLLQYMISGDFKYIIKTDDQFIYSMIIDIEACHEESRRLIDIVSENIRELVEFGYIESVVTQVLNIDPSDYSINTGFR